MKKKVVSVRLREELVFAIDHYTKKMNLPSRTDFLKKALEFYVSKRQRKG